MTVEIYALIFLVVAVIAIFISFKLYERKMNKFHAQFQKGLFLDYYAFEGHGKFRKENLIISYEILDRDGRYLLCHQCDLKTDVTTEIDIDIDTQYQDKVVLRAPNGVIMNTFQFER